METKRVLGKNEALANSLEQKLISQQKIKSDLSAHIFEKFK